MAGDVSHVLGKCDKLSWPGLVWIELDSVLVECSPYRDKQAQFQQRDS